MNLSPESFWDQTPRTFSICIRGAVSREEREHRDRAWAVWHSAALVRIKKLPKLDTLVGKAAKAARPTGKPKSPEELLAKAAQWEALLNSKG